MGESACLMHSFSHDTRIPNRPTNEGNHVHVLGESISFGRFTSESLGWEKWSSVPHKRYVEEAKSYAQPGSVAQKKAFFEAHYKKIAAQKAAAAALLEQEKAAAAASRVNEGVCDAIQTVHDSETTKLMSHDSLKAVIKCHNSNETTIDDNLVATTTNSIKNLEDHVSDNDSRTLQTKRPLLKEFTQPVIRRKSVVASLVSSIKQNPSIISLSPANYGASVHSRKENISAPRTRKPATNDYVDKRPAPKSLEGSLVSSIKQKPSMISLSPANYGASVHSRKENISAPKTRKPATDNYIDKRPAPTSLEGSVNSTSVREPSKLNSLDVQKMQRPKPSPNGRTTPKRSATPLKTPTKVFVNGSGKQPLATPSSENRSSRSQSTYRNKLQSPTTPSPFVLRTEGRAARRKQNLEEKFNEKEAQMQQQTKLKEKAETEFRRMRQSFCFKARPLPNFYKGRETPENQTKKTPEADMKAFTPCRKPLSSMSSTKIKSSRRLWKSNDQNPTQHPLFSVAGIMSHENMSSKSIRL